MRGGVRKADKTEAAGGVGASKVDVYAKGAPLGAVKDSTTLRGGSGTSRVLDATVPPFTPAARAGAAPAAHAGTAPFVPSEVATRGDDLSEKAVRLSLAAARAKDAMDVALEAVEIALARRRVLESELAEALERVEQVQIPPPGAGGTGKQRRAVRRLAQLSPLAEAAECRRNLNRNWREGVRLVKNFNRLAAKAWEAEDAARTALARSEAMRLADAAGDVLLVTPEVAETRVADAPDGTTSPSGLEVDSAPEILFGSFLPGELSSVRSEDRHSPDGTTSPSGLEVDSAPEILFGSFLPGELSSVRSEDRHSPLSSFRPDHASSPRASRARHVVTPCDSAPAEEVVAARPRRAPRNDRDLLLLKRASVLEPGLAVPKGSPTWDAQAVSAAPMPSAAAEAQSARASTMSKATSRVRGQGRLTTPPSVSEVTESAQPTPNGNTLLPSSGDIPALPGRSARRAAATREARAKMKGEAAASVRAAKRATRQRKNARKEAAQTSTPALPLVPYVASARVSRPISMVGAPLCVVRAQRTVLQCPASRRVRMLVDSGAGTVLFTATQGALWGPCSDHTIRATDAQGSTFDATGGEELYGRLQVRNRGTNGQADRCVCILLLVYP